MNIYAIIILTTLVVSYILDVVTNLFNLKHLSEKLPDEFDGVYDAEAYQKSQEYTKVNTRFGILTSSLSLAATLMFWFLGGFNYIDKIARQWDLNNIYTGLIYIGLLVLLRSVFSLPFSLYSTFVIEERFGFNRTTVKTFILDILKGLLLSLVLGVPLLAGLLYFFEVAGDYAWIYAWIATTLFTLFVQFIAPTWIMPIFNKFTPLEDGDLKKEIISYTNSVNFPLRGVFVMDGSKRSSKSNAFFTGFGKNKRIVLFDTLIKKHTVDELIAVLAHEVGHYKKKHIIIGMLISILHMGIVFYLLSVFLSHQGLYDAFYMNQTSVYAGLIFFGLLYAPIEMILSVFLQLFSRRNEFQADNFAVKTIKHTESMINALKKLSKDNLSNLTPHPLYVFLNYSHPPVLKRIKAIRHSE